MTREELIALAEKMVISKEWINAPYEIRGMDENGNLLPDTMPPFRFTEETVAEATEALARNDKETLLRLRVKQFVMP